MVVLGRLGEAYSLRGWIRVHFFSEQADAFGDMPQWWLAQSADERAVQAAHSVRSAHAVGSSSQWQPHELSALKPHGKGYVAKFAGIDDRTAAEAIEGCFVGAPRAVLPETTGDEYYWVDLLDLDVVNEEGARLGRVAELMRSGAHEILCVRNESGQERLLPFVAAVVKEVDRGQRMIRVAWGVDW